MLTASAEDSGAASIVATAIGRLGIAAWALDRAEDAGLLSRTGAGLQFKHPLVRSAIYHGAAPSERRAVHAVLADVLIGRDDERRAWHLAGAAVGDDAVAANAVHVAESSARRGAFAEAAAAYERSARLPAAGPHRTRRLAAAADSARLAGRPEHASALVDEGFAGGLDDTSKEMLLAARGQLALQDGKQEVAFRSFLDAAGLADDRARASGLLSAAMSAATQLGIGAVEEAAERLRLLGPPGDPASELFVAQALGTAASIAGRNDAHELIARAVRLVDERSVALDSASELFWAGRVNLMLGRQTVAIAYAQRALDSARADGASGLLPQALQLLASSAHDAGRWPESYAAAGEAVRLADEVGNRASACASLGVLAEIDAATGNEVACREHAEAAIAIAIAAGLGYYRERAERALGHLELALGRFAVAAEQLEGVWRRLRDAGIREQNVTPAWVLVESYVRLGRSEDACRLLGDAEREMPPLAPSEEAVILRCHGLLADDLRPFFKQALAAHATTDRDEVFPFELARTLICFGERLRRVGERREARVHLRSALAAFDELGASAWSKRAETELRATGERRRDRGASRVHLTPREMQIALAVSEGRSNNDVAAALYVTPKTVEFHLTRIYRKLGVRSRAELVRRFAGGNRSSTRLEADLPAGQGRDG